MILDPQLIPFILVPLELEAALLDSGGLSGSAYPSDSCTVVLIEITADLESQVEIVSKVPGNPSESLQTDYTSRLWFAESKKDVRCPFPGPRKRCRPCDVGNSGCFAKVKQVSATRDSNSPWAGASIRRTRPPVTPTCEVTSKSAVPLRQPLDFAEVLAKLATVLYEPRNSQSLEEFGLDMGRATTEKKYSEVLYGGGSGGRGFPRLGGHAPMQRILHTRHECPGVIIAAHRTEVRVDLATLLEESGSGERQAVEYPLQSPKLAVGQRDGHRRPRRGQNRRIRKPARHSVRSTGCSSLRQRTVARTVRRPTHDQTSTGRPPKFQQSSHGTGKRLRSTAMQERMELAAARAVPARRSSRRPCGGTEPLKNKDGGAKAQKPKKAGQS